MNRYTNFYYLSKDINGVYDGIPSCDIWKDIDVPIRISVTLHPFNMIYICQKCDTNNNTISDQN